MASTDITVSTFERTQISRGAKLVTVAIGVLAALAITELGLRIGEFSYPIFYTTDPDRGVALKPGQKGWYRKEGESYVSINSAGMRDLEHTLAKPSNTFRIAVVGDSYAEALQVPMQNAFWYIMQDRLRGCGAFGGRNIEVLNFGVSGYGTAQELITLQRHVWQYDPDMILLAVTTNNDITDNVRELKRTDEIPYFVLKDGRLELDDSFRTTKAFRMRDSTLNRIGRWFSDNFRTVQMVGLAHRGIKRKWDELRASFKTHASEAGDNRPGEEAGIDNLVYRTPDNPQWQNAWAVTESLITRMRDEVRSHGKRFVVVTLSNGVQVWPVPEARENFMKRLGVDSLFYPDMRIKALGERAGFEVLTLAPALKDYAEKNSLFLHGFDKDLGNGHWNEAGHRVSGEMLAAKFCGEKPL